MTDRKRWALLLAAVALGLLFAAGQARYRFRHPALTSTQLVMQPGFWLPWRSGD